MHVSFVNTYILSNKKINIKTLHVWSFDFILLKVKRIAHLGQFDIVSFYIVL